MSRMIQGSTKKPPWRIYNTVDVAAIFIGRTCSKDASALDKGAFSSGVDQI